MKLITYKKDTSIRPGLLTDKGIIDITSNWPGSDPPQSVKQILTLGDPCLEKLKQLEQNTEDFLAADSVKLLAPIPSPGKLLALAGNYSEHIIECGLKLGLTDSPRSNTVPRPFMMPATAAAGPNDEIPWPPYSEQVDHEIELGIVIGKKAKSVSIEQATDYIAGYTICNDISARSVTFTAARKTRPWDEFYDWLNGKWSDGFFPMGPYILTKDEVQDAQKLDMQLTVNGDLRQNANTEQMIYHIPDIVSFLSHIVTLEPGDVIATGTPAGVAAATGKFLAPGDIVEATIEKLGTLKNTIGPKPEKLYEPLA
jgi:2-keto-4-pentenoate hydratase/2-oxohepta-3-ene-1,7-dioic acid hydratase in catechol pathway